MLPAEAVAQIIQKKAEENGLNYKTAIAVAKAESGLNPQAYNPEWHYNAQGEKICQGSYGLFQVSCIHYKEDPTKLYDIDFNIEMAIKIQKASGWKQPWYTTCTTKVNCS